MNEVLDWLLGPRERWQQRRRLDSQLSDFLDSSRETDPAENAESTPPVDEEIRLHAVWMAESYPPSFFDSLLDAVRRLAAEDRFISRDPPAERLEQSLRLGGSGWLPLGPVVSPDSRLYAHASPIKTAERRLEKSCSDATCVADKGDAEHFITREGVAGMADLQGVFARE